MNKRLVGYSKISIFVLIVVSILIILPFFVLSINSSPTLSTVNDSDADGNIELTWTNDTNATLYKIYRNISNITTLTGLTSIANTTALSFEDNTTVNGTTYFYAITSVNITDENISVFSNILNSTANDTIVPKKITSLNATSLLNGTVNVTWDIVTTDINGNSELNNTYLIFRNTNASAINTTNKTSQIANTTNIFYLDSNATVGTNYTYVIGVLDDGNNYNNSQISTTSNTTTNASWTNLVSDNDHTNRSGGQMVYRSSTNQLFFYGGLTNDTGNEDNETWVYNLTTDTWTNLTSNFPIDNSGTSIRDFYGMVYDDVNDQVILFGGNNGVPPSNRTWSFNFTQNTWSELVPANRLPNVEAFATSYDNDTQQIFLFGGMIDPGSNTIINETWSYNISANNWTNLTASISSGSPPKRQFSSMVYDPNKKRLVLFGGDDTSNYFNDTWEYNVSNNTWSQLNLVTAPSARSAFSMSRDPENGNIFLFGGESGSSGGKIYNDLWMFNVTSDTWSEISLASPPSNRSRSFATGANNTIYILGGEDPWTSSLLADLSKLIPLDKITEITTTMHGPTTTVIPSCTESWSCSAWSAFSSCSGNTQTRTRTCNDLNSCGTTSSKPATSDSQSCSSGGGGGGGIIVVNKCVENGPYDEIVSECSSNSKRIIHRTFDCSSPQDIVTECEKNCIPVKDVCEDSKPSECAKGVKNLISNCKKISASGKVCKTFTKKYYCENKCTSIKIICGPFNPPACVPGVVNVISSCENIAADGKVCESFNRVVECPSCTDPPNYKKGLWQPEKCTKNNQILTRQSIDENGCYPPRTEVAECGTCNLQCPKYYDKTKRKPKPVNGCWVPSLDIGKKIKCDPPTTFITSSKQKIPLDCKKLRQLFVNKKHLSDAEENQLSECNKLYLQPQNTKHDSPSNVNTPPYRLGGSGISPYQIILTNDKSLTCEYKSLPESEYINHKISSSEFNDQFTDSSLSLTGLTGYLIDSKRLPIYVPKYLKPIARPRGPDITRVESNFCAGEYRSNIQSNLEKAKTNDKKGQKLRNCKPSGGGVCTNPKVGVIDSDYSDLLNKLKEMSGKAIALVTKLLDSDGSQTLDKINERIKQLEAELDAYTEYWNKNAGKYGSKGANAKTAFKKMRPESDLNSELFALKEYAKNLKRNIKGINNLADVNTLGIEAANVLGAAADDARAAADHAKAARDEIQAMIPPPCPEAHLGKWLEQARLASITAQAAAVSTEAMQNDLGNMAAKLQFNVNNPDLSDSEKMTAAINTVLDAIDSMSSAIVSAINANIYDSSAQRALAAAKLELTKCEKCTDRPEPTYYKRDPVTGACNLGCELPAGKTWYPPNNDFKVVPFLIPEWIDPIPGMHLDGENNHEDVIIEGNGDKTLITPTDRPRISSISLGSNAVSEGSQVSVSVGVGNAHKVERVVITTRASDGNSSETILYDDGTHGDEEAGDGIYGGNIDTTGFVTGRYGIDINVAGTDGSSLKITNLGSLYIGAKGSYSSETVELTDEERSKIKEHNSLVTELTDLADKRSELRNQWLSGQREENEIRFDSNLSDSEKTAKITKIEGRQEGIVSQIEEVDNQILEKRSSIQTLQTELATTIAKLDAARKPTEKRKKNTLPKRSEYAKTNTRSYNSFVSDNQGSEVREKRNPSKPSQSTVPYEAGLTPKEAADDVKTPADTQASEALENQVRRIVSENSQPVKDAINSGEYSEAAKLATTTITTELEQLASQQTNERDAVKIRSVAREFEQIDSLLSAPSTGDSESERQQSLLDGRASANAIVTNAEVKLGLSDYKIFGKGSVEEQIAGLKSTEDSASSQLLVHYEGIGIMSDEQVVSQQSAYIEARTRHLLIQSIVYSNHGSSQSPVSSAGLEFDLSPKTEQTEPETLVTIKIILSGYNGDNEYEIITKLRNAQNKVSNTEAREVYSQAITLLKEGSASEYAINLLTNSLKNGTVIEPGSSLLLSDFSKSNLVVETTNQLFDLDRETAKATQIQIEIEIATETYQPEFTKFDTPKKCGEELKSIKASLEAQQVAINNALNYIQQLEQEIEDIQNPGIASRIYGWFADKGTVAEKRTSIQFTKNQLEKLIQGYKNTVARRTKLLHECSQGQEKSTQAFLLGSAGLASDNDVINVFNQAPKTTTQQTEATEYKTQILINAMEDKREEESASESKEWETYYEIEDHYKSWDVLSQGPWLVERWTIGWATGQGDTASAEMRKHERRAKSHRDNQVMLDVTSYLLSKVELDNNCFKGLENLDPNQIQNLLVDFKIPEYVSEFLDDARNLPGIPDDLKNSSDKYVIAIEFFKFLRSNNPILVELESKCRGLWTATKQADEYLRRADQESSAVKAYGYYKAALSLSEEGSDNWNRAHDRILELEDGSIFGQLGEALYEAVTFDSDNADQIERLLSGDIDWRLTLSELSMEQYGSILTDAAFDPLNFLMGIPLLTKLGKVPMVTELIARLETIANKIPAVAKFIKGEKVIAAESEFAVAITTEGGKVVGNAVERVADAKSALRIANGQFQSARRTGRGLDAAQTAFKSAEEELAAANTALDAAGSIGPQAETALEAWNAVKEARLIRNAELVSNGATSVLKTPIYVVKASSKSKNKVKAILVREARAFKSSQTAERASRVLNIENDLALIQKAEQSYKSAGLWSTYLTVAGREHRANVLTLIDNFADATVDLDKAITLKAAPENIARAQAAYDAARVALIEGTNSAISAAVAAEKTAQITAETRGEPEVAEQLVDTTPKLRGLQTNKIHSADDVTVAFDGVRPDKIKGFRLGGGASKQGEVIEVDGVEYVVQRLGNAEYDKIQLSDELVVRSLIEEFGTGEFRTPRAFGYETEDGSVYLVQEYIPGANHNPEAFFSLSESQRAEMAGFMHAFGLGDVNYGNIIFDANGKPIAIDFSGAFSRSSSEARSGFLSSVRNLGNQPWISRRQFNDIETYLDTITRWETLAADPNFDVRLRTLFIESGYTPEKADELVSTVKFNIGRMRSDIEDEVKIVNEFYDFKPGVTPTVTDDISVQGTVLVDEDLLETRANSHVIDDTVDELDEISNDLVDEIVVELEADDIEKSIGELVDDMTTDSLTGAKTYRAGSVQTVDNLAELGEEGGETALIYLEGSKLRAANDLPAGHSAGNAYVRIYVDTVTEHFENLGYKVNVYRGPNGAVIIQGDIPADVVRNELTALRTKLDQAFTNPANIEGAGNLFEQGINGGMRVGYTRITVPQGVSWEEAKSLYYQGLREVGSAAESLKMAITPGIEPFTGMMTFEEALTLWNKNADEMLQLFNNYIPPEATAGTLRVVEDQVAVVEKALEDFRATGSAAARQTLADELDKLIQMATRPPRFEGTEGLIDIGRAQRELEDAFSSGEFVIVASGDLDFLGTYFKNTVVEGADEVYASLYESMAEAVRTYNAENGLSISVQVAKQSSGDEYQIIMKFAEGTENAEIHARNIMESVRAAVEDAGNLNPISVGKIDKDVGILRGEGGVTTTLTSDFRRIRSLDDYKKSLEEAEKFLNIRKWIISKNTAGSHLTPEEAENALIFMRDFAEAGKDNPQALSKLYTALIENEDELKAALSRGGTMGAQDIDNLIKDVEIKLGIRSPESITAPPIMGTNPRKLALSYRSTYEDDPRYVILSETFEDDIRSTLRTAGVPEDQLDEVVERTLRNLPRADGRILDDGSMAVYNNPLDTSGGDWFSRRTLSDGRVRIIKVDEVGHGDEAVRRLALFQQAEEELSGSELPLDEYLKELNKRVVEFNKKLDSASESRTAFSVIEIDGNTMRYVTSEERIFLYNSRTGEVTQLGGSALDFNPRIGLGTEIKSTGEEVVYTVQEVNLGEGDMIVMPSDGIIDAQEATRSSKARKAIADNIGENACNSPEEVRNSLVAGLDEQVDDESIIIIRYSEVPEVAVDPAEYFPGFIGPGAQLVGEEHLVEIARFLKNGDSVKALEYFNLKKIDIAESVRDKVETRILIEDVSDLFRRFGGNDISRSDAIRQLKGSLIDNGIITVEDPNIRKAFDLKTNPTTGVGTDKYNLIDLQDQLGLQYDTMVEVMRNLRARFRQVLGLERNSVLATP